MSVRTRAGGRTVTAVTSGGAPTRRSFAALAAEIAARPSAGALRLVAVDGRAGSGKSTFARRLSESLAGAPLLPVDDFLSWDDLTDFWPRLEAEVLEPLLSGRSARYQQRDWERDPDGRSLGVWRELPFAPIVIVEGVGSARRAIRSRLAYAIWIETPAAVCLARGLARDGEGRRGAWLAWQTREGTFFRADPISRHADLVVDGLGGIDGGADEFRAWPRDAVSALDT